MATGLPEPASIFVTDNPVLRAAVREAVVKHDLERTSVLPAAGGFGPKPHGESSTYFFRGVPVIGLVSGPVYLLTEDDALDKVAVNRLAPTAAAFADIIARLDRAPPHLLRRPAEASLR